MEWWSYISSKKNFNKCSDVFCIHSGSQELLLFGRIKITFGGHYKILNFKIHQQFNIPMVYFKLKLRNPSPALALALAIAWAARVCTNMQLISLSLSLVSSRLCLYSSQPFTQRAALQHIHWSWCPMLSNHQCSVQSDYYSHGRVVWSSQFAQPKHSSAVPCPAHPMPISPYFSANSTQIFMKL